MKSSIKSLKIFLSLVVVLIVMTLTVALVITSYNSAFNALEKSYLNQLKNFNNEISSQLEDYFIRQENIARTIADTGYVIDAVENGRYEQVRRFLRSMYKEMGDYENLFISTASTPSRILVDSLGGKTVGNRWGESGESKRNLTEALAGRVSISTAYKSSVSGEAIILVTAPVMRNGRVRAIVGLPFRVGQYAQGLVKNLKIGKTGYCYLINEAGIAFAHPDIKNVFQLKLNDYEWGRELLNSQSGAVIYYKWEGKDKIQTFVKNDKYNYISASTIYLDDINDDAYAMAMGMIIAAVIALVVSAFIIYFIISLRLKPLEACKRIMAAVAEGDLTKKYTAKLSSDEIGDVLRAVNLMVDQLSRIVRGILESSTTVSTASKEINSTAQSLSQTASEEASNVEEITSSMEEIGATINQNTDNARQTDEIASNTAEQGVEGGKAVADTVQAMRQIAEKINLIEDIAYQTNLLALNAAIEAARAGEHGKGFAVVATEVRKLAERSQVAAQEISELSGSSVDVAEKAGALLEEIVPSIKKTSDLVQDITAASEQQSDGVAQINAGMEQLSEVTQQTASASEELASTADILATHAKQLDEMVSFFNISEKDS